MCIIVRVITWYKNWDRINEDRCNPDGLFPAAKWNCLPVVQDFIFPGIRVVDFYKADLMERSSSSSFIKQI